MGYSTAPIILRAFLNGREGPPVLKQPVPQGESAMPRITRTVLAALVSLGVIIGIYTSVEGLSTSPNKVGAHYVSSSLINPNYYRAATNLMPMQVDQHRSGHDCNSDSPVAPDD